MGLHVTHAPASYVGLAVCRHAAAAALSSPLRRWAGPAITNTLPSAQVSTGRCTALHGAQQHTASSHVFLVMSSSADSSVLMCQVTHPYSCARLGVERAGPVGMPVVSGNVSSPPLSAWEGARGGGAQGSQGLGGGREGGPLVGKVGHRPLRGWPGVQRRVLGVLGERRRVWGVLGVLGVLGVCKVC